MVGLYYGEEPDEAASEGGAATGRIARYAGGDDYHEVLLDRVRALEAALRGCGVSVVRAGCGCALDGRWEQSDPRHVCRGRWNLRGEVLALGVTRMPGPNHPTDSRSIAIGHGHSLRLPIPKNVQPLAPHTGRIGLEAQSDRTMLLPARVVVSAAREKPDAGLVESLHLALDCEFRLKREHGIVVEIARSEDGV